MRLRDRPPDLWQHGAASVIACRSPRKMPANCWNDRQTWLSTVLWPDGVYPPRYNRLGAFLSRVAGSRPAGRAKTQAGRLHPRRAPFTPHLRGPLRPAPCAWALRAEARQLAKLRPRDTLRVARLSTSDRRSAFSAGRAGSGPGSAPGKSQQSFIIHEYQPWSARQSEVPLSSGEER
jgi:hypothetical protein